MGFESKSELVARELRRLIQNHEIAPGEVLRQRELAERFGVSPTPVREALQRLEAEGYVASELHRGASVVRHDEDRDRENSLIRAVLEALAAAWAAERCTERDIEEIKELHERFHDDLNGDKVFELNRQFHLRIYQASGSVVLLNLIQQLWVAFRGGPNVRRLTESVPEHEEILQAIIDRNPEAAALATKRHILGAMRYIPFTQETLGYIPMPVSGSPETDSALSQGPEAG